MDPEVENLQNALTQAENRLHHKLTTPEFEEHTEMHTQDLGLDEDVV